MREEVDRGKSRNMNNPRTSFSGNIPVDPRPKTEVLSDDYIDLQVTNPRISVCQSSLMVPSIFSFSHSCCNEKGVQM